MGPRTLIDGIRRLLHQRQAQADLDDEVSQFLAMSAEEHMRRGLSRADAERAARIEFGGVESAKEAVRSAGWDGALETFVRDVTGGLRAMRHSPTFTIVACLTLALGVGANTAMFSVVNAVLLRPLPYHDPQRLALIWTDDARRGLHEERTAYRTILDWRADNRTMEAIGFYAAGRTSIGTGAAREVARQAHVSGNLFALLGVPTAVGRPIGMDDERDAAPVAVISYALWQKRFGGDTAVIGKMLEADESEKGSGPDQRIIGVMPKSFYFPDKQTDIWIPATTYWRFRRESVERFDSWARRWTGVARLRPDVRLADAQADLSRIGARLSANYHSDVPDFPGFSTNAVSMLDHVAGRNLQRALWLLVGAVGLVLLVACANVANLLLARGSARQHELSVRRALGASRGRLIRQLLVESAVLATVGGVAGLFVAVAATRLVTVAAASRIPRIEETSFDGRVFVFAVTLSLISGLLFGIVPAVRASGAQAGAALNASARASSSLGARRTREILVMAECALAIILLVGAGLLVRSLARVRSVNPGFDAAHVLTMRLVLPPETPPTAEERAQGSSLSQSRAGARERMLYDLGARIASIPGVEYAGFIDDMFITGQANGAITIPGRPTDSLTAGELNEASVTPDFFPALRVPLHAGRFPTREDAAIKVRALWSTLVSGPSLDDNARRAIAEPVVVNQAFVRRFFPAEDPIGKRFCIDPTSKTYWYQIVGVVGDMHRQGLEHAAIPEYFGPLIPSDNGRVDLLVRARQDPTPQAPTIRRLVMAGIPGVIVPSVSTAERQLGEFSAERKFQTWLFASFAAIALSLAMIGVYGVLHYAIAERRREIGVRIALGASPSDVVAMAMREGMRSPLIGVAMGVLGALALSRTLDHLLFETGSTDLVTYAAVVVLLGLSAAIACYLPARRAATIDPIVTLKQD